MRRAAPTRTVPGASARQRSPLLMAVAIAAAVASDLSGPQPAAADLEVLIKGATRSILARSGDSLAGGGTLRNGFDKVYWLPVGPGARGFLFLNHELPTPNGGMSRLAYENGSITDRRQWMTGTNYNCLGTITSWGAMLSCEEHPPAEGDSIGYVLEVDRDTPNVWRRLWAMGHFSHESVIEHPLTGEFYLTDDSPQGFFFKFVPAQYGSLDEGFLYALREPTRDWVLITDVVNARAQAFALGASYHPHPEDLAYNPVDGNIYIAITGQFDDPPNEFGYILRFSPKENRMERWFSADGEPLANPDNIEIDSLGNLIVMEDQFPQHIGLFGPNEALLLRLDGSIEPILRGLDIYGEPTGLIFAGGDDGDTRFWLSWQNGASGSELIEVNAPAGWNETSNTGVDASERAASAPLRLAVSPNPSSGERTWIRVAASPGSPVRVEIFDVRGALWRTLSVQSAAGASEVAVAWDGLGGGGRRAPSGHYVVRALAGGRTATARVTRIR